MKRRKKHTFESGEAGRIPRTLVLGSLFKNMQYQKIENKIGEVKYRKKLTKQYLGKNKFFPSEPDTKEIISALKDRISSTKNDFTFLKKQDVSLTPYLEIGAEFGHRASILEEKYNSSGFALDLSLESLTQAPFFAKKLKLKKIPQRICADAYHLPFLNNSFEFVFCYQTLHHFPDPSPIIGEIYRVLAPGGHFFVNEEPVSQRLNLNLWRRPTKLRAWEKAIKYTFILPFVSTIGKTETNHRILEETFNIKTWEKSLNCFENATVWLKPYPFGQESKINKKKSAGWLKPNPLTRSLINLSGGGIKILARKGGKLQNKVNSQIESFLACPLCRKIMTPKLFCSKCRTGYQSFKRIKLLLEKRLMVKLYPKLTNV